MQKIEYKRNCPGCGNEILYISYDSFRHVKKTSKCRYCSNIRSDKSKKAISIKQTGRKLSLDTKLKMSNFQKIRYSNPLELIKMKNAVKRAMHRPDVRKKHVEALHKTRWLKVRTDKGQLELLEKWNRLGFKFEPNYQVHTDLDLFYVDGYDKEHNIVLEYDGKYHNIIGQQQKDLIRQQKIIDILKPKKFWRYSSENKTIKNVLGV